MPRGKKEEIQEEVQVKPVEQIEAGTIEHLKFRMIDVGLKLCDDLMNGKARSEETALKAVVEIFEAVK